MCLGVYIGTNKKIEIPTSFAFGTLAIEPRQTNRAALKDFAYCYYLGRKGTGEQLECSCMLSEYLDWNEDGIHSYPDGMAVEASIDPFETLQLYCQTALSGDGFAILLCDDEPGLKNDAPMYEYDQLALRLSRIKNGEFLFCSPMDLFPWRCYHLVPDENIHRKPNPPMERVDV